MFARAYARDSKRASGKVFPIMDHRPRTLAIPMPILTLGDRGLETPSAEGTEWSSHLSSEISALHATLDAFRTNNGFGRAIAAPQVGVTKRMIAMNLSSTLA
jgi:peptide deformylase